MTESASTSQRSWKKRLFALAVGAVGGYVFYQLNLPLPWLLGAMSTCLILVLFNGPVQGDRNLAQIMRIVLGIAIGSAFSPAVFDRASEMAASLAFILPYVILMGLLGYFYFQKVAGFDKPTAFFSSMPGGLQDMIAMGADLGASERTLALVHATRILVLVFLLPFVIQWIGDVELGSRSRNGVSFLDNSLMDYAILTACGIFGWLAARRLKISGATIVGPMIASAIVHVAGITEARPPIELTNIAQWAIGVHVGCMYLGSTPREIGRIVGQSLGYIFLILILTSGFTAVVSTIVDVDLISIILAFSPGGQSEMNLIALVLGADVAYIALHHLIRLFIVILGSQIVFKYLLKKET
jgi:hypothetical protein